MLAIFKREISSFFTTPIGYLVIGMFLLFNGLFLWVFHTGFNIPDGGFADLSLFFLLAPWVFLLLIPAVTMKSFAEERRLGTLELLLINPLRPGSIITGKFLGAMSLVIIALLPTTLYAYAVSELAAPGGGLDLGMLFGSYAGLLFLAANYVAIGIFTSTLTDNQIIAFMAALLICFTAYYGFEALATLVGDGRLVLSLRDLGMKAHAESMARGVLDTRDLIYFVSLSALFLYLAVLQLQSLRK